MLAFVIGWWHDLSKTWPRGSAANTSPRNLGNNLFFSSVFFREQDRCCRTIRFRDDQETILLSIDVRRNDRKAVLPGQVVRFPVESHQRRRSHRSCVAQGIPWRRLVQTPGRFSRHKECPELGNHECKWESFDMAPTSLHWPALHWPRYARPAATGLAFARSRCRPCRSPSSR